MIRNREIDPQHLQERAFLTKKNMGEETVYSVACTRRKIRGQRIQLGEWDSVIV